MSSILPATLWLALSTPASAQSVYLHYDFDGAGTTSAGHTFADDSGNGNDGILVDNGTLDNGAYVTSPAAFGQAWQDPGEGSLADGDRVDLTVPFAPGASTPWTISFWLDMYGGAVRPLFDESSLQDELYIRADSVNEVSLDIHGQGHVVWDTAGIVTQSSFSHYVLTADPAGIAGVDQDGDGQPDNIALYVDGELMGTSSTGLSTYQTDVIMTNLGDGTANTVFAKDSAGTYDELWVIEGAALGPMAVRQLRLRNLVCWSTNDGDGDGVPDDCDVCPAEDASGCDPDANGCRDDADSDGLLDCEEDPNGDDVYDEDTDWDSIPDYLDDDDDGDGIPTLAEDVDGDGDYAEHDSDGDGTPNYLDYWGVDISATLTGGVPSDVVVTDAPPGSTVVFFLSRWQGFSYACIPGGGPCLGLWNPRLVDTVVTPESGIATGTVLVPAAAAGRTLYLQAAVLDPSQDQVTRVLGVTVQ